MFGSGRRRRRGGEWMRIGFWIYHPVGTEAVLDVCLFLDQGLDVWGGVMSV